MARGYEQIYDTLLPRLKNLNFAEAAPRLGMNLNADGAAEVDFFDTRYNIDRDGVRPIDGKPRNINFYNVLAYYALSDGAGEPTWEFQPLRASNHGYSDLSWLTRTLKMEYEGQYAKFETAALSIGGKFVGQSNDGGYERVFLALPKIPLKAIYYESDEEFPFELKILVDRHAPRFLEFECLAFMCGCFVKALENAGKKNLDQYNEPKNNF